MRRGLSLLLLLLGAPSCGMLTSADIVRARHARQFGCPEPQVHAVELGDGTVRAWGCGPEVTYVCRQDTYCRPEPGAVVRDSGAHRHHTEYSGSHATPPQNLAPPSQGYGVAGTTHTGGAQATHSSGTAAGGPSAGGGPTAPVAAMSPADAVRRLLDTRRAEILVCTGRSAVGVRATFAADGVLDLALQGELRGSPEEDCVRNALRELRISAPDHSGVVVHLVR